MKKNNFLFFLAFAALLPLSFAGVSEFAAKNTYVVLNSQNYEDLVSGAVWAAQKGYNFAFIANNGQGALWKEKFSSTEANYYYFESASPVFLGMEGQLKPATSADTQFMLDETIAAGKLHRSFENPKLIYAKEERLSSLFAQMSKTNFAIIVAKGRGQDAISAAPYAAAKGGGIYFATGQDAPALAQSLLNKGKDVLAYGEICDSIIPFESEINCINRGSIFLDNSYLLQLYSEEFSPSQALFASGKVFESSIISTKYPIALVGRTEASPELIGWIASSKIGSGLVFEGDANIKGAIATIKQERALPVFVKLGEGSLGSSNMQPLNTMQLPCSATMVEITSVIYLEESGGFEMNVTNIGEGKAHVRAVAMLEGGESASSGLIKVLPGESQIIFVPINASSYTNSGIIDTAAFHIYLGSDPYVVESIDVIVFSGILVHKAPSAGEQGMREYAKGGSNAISLIVVLILLVIAVYLIMHINSPGASRIVLDRNEIGRARERRHKSRRKRRRGHK
ncbi:hypothetical protein COU37_04820 [Candidatus Micrarchaeota archaeon CG10_big_fil_rev_8_21_14_0_10_45_29]|nr:MAG: hypothetical protein COU37_04820 [Candidatus Micrarchaeota archaeon CG10_big_fil_rev_8_21_14_0_10_45_29]